MATLTDYGGDVVGNVCDELEARTRAAENAGVPRHVLLEGATEFGLPVHTKI